MCGISGYVGHTSASIAKSRVKKMNQALSHRGPDGHGMTVASNVILAMRRLAIIDVAGGQQPLFNEDKSIAIVGNGELYNYIELQKWLKKKGHTLATGSDIEVFAHLYEEFGWEAVKKVKGMFAIALHDRKKKKVYLFRDRVGEKPLYYTMINKELYFASELKSLLTLPIDKSLNPFSIDEYFHLYYIPEPKTAFKAVHKLPAGSVMEINCKNISAKITTYWDFDSNKMQLKEHPAPVIKKLFDDSCRLTLRSDVPVAVSLSSGIDSSAIAMLSQKHVKDNLVAVTVGYRNARHVDERKAAAKLTKKIGMKHILSQLSSRSVVKEFPKLVWDCDDLIAEIGMFNINDIYKTARSNNIKVMLSGVGSDELFWGYGWFRKAASTTLKKRQLDNNPIIKKLRTYIPNRFKKPRSYTPLFGWINNLFLPTEQLVMSDLRTPFKGGKVLENFYSKSFKRQITKEQQYQFLQYPTGTSKYQQLHRLMELLFSRWLVSHAIAINDRLSMANGVEVRLPFMDYQLVEAAFNYSKVVEAYDKPSKDILKKAMKNILPEDIMKKPKKGFTPPVGRWLLQLIFYYKYLLKDGFVVKEGILDKNKLWQLDMLLLNPVNWYPVFQVIVLEVWGREFVWKQSISEITPKLTMFL